MSAVIQSVNFTPNDVFHELVDLDISKACSFDNSTPKLLKLSAEFISEPLSQIFNQSMSSGSLPSDWIHKKNECCLVNNYRPISLTLVVVKVMERIICKHLISALEKFKCISAN